MAAPRVTTIRTAMTDPLITLAQWMSPSFPVGAFAYSHGLEQAIADGSVATARDLQLWLADVIQVGAGRSDISFLAAAYHGQDLPAIDRAARAFAASAERLQETDLQGAAFCDTVNPVWGLSLPRLTYPVAVGAAAAACALPLEATARLYLHAMIANLTSAAIRLVPLGQTDGQHVLTALAPLIEKTATTAQSVPLPEITACAFATDVAAMRHEVLQPRIFRT